MTHRCQGTMAIVRNFGKPDFFPTITYNSNRQEITDVLQVKEKPADRPDIASLVFPFQAT